MKNIYHFFIAYLSVYQQLVFSQNIGINTPVPKETLHVTGNIQVTGGLKVANGFGTAGQLLQTNGTNMSWVNAPAASTNNNGNLGYGSWGDCATNANITEYIPVTDPDATGSQQPFFGSSVAINGEYAIVGTPQESLTGNSKGSATIFKLVNNEWVFYQKIVDPNGQVGDRFGESVAIENDFVMVGSVNDAETVTQQGSVSVFKLVLGTWVYQQKLVDTINPANLDGFGFSISMSGDFCIIGAYRDDHLSGGNDQGSAFIYRLNAELWTFFQQLTDSNAGLFREEFGYDVDINGNYIIVGAPSTTNTVSGQGIAVLYFFNGTAWVQQQRIFKNSLIQTNEQFGGSVAISSGFAVVGAKYTDVPLFTNAGSASIYQLNGTTWGFSNILYNTAGGEPGTDDEFGSQIDINNDYLIIGCNRDDAPAFDQGSATIYRRIGNNWQLYQFTKDPSGEFGNSFGSAVALDASTFRFLIGAPFAFGAKGKAVFGKIN